MPSKKHSKHRRPLPLSMLRSFDEVLWSKYPGLSDSEKRIIRKRFLAGTKPAEIEKSQKQATANANKMFYLELGNYIAAQLRDKNLRKERVSAPTVLEEVPANNLEEINKNYSRLKKQYGKGHGTMTRLFANAILTLTGNKNGFSDYEIPSHPHPVSKGAMRTRESHEFLKRVFRSCSGFEVIETGVEGFDNFDFVIFRRKGTDYLHSFDNNPKKGIVLGELQGLKRGLDKLRDSGQEAQEDLFWIDYVPCKLPNPEAVERGRRYKKVLRKYAPAIYPDLVKMRKDPYWGDSLLLISD